VIGDRHAGEEMGLAGALVGQAVGRDQSAGDREALRHQPLFAGLTAERLARLTQGAFVQGLPKGILLFGQGEEASFLHVILEGRVALFGSIEGEAEEVVEVFGAGDAIIAPAVLLRRPYLMSGRVVSEARILLIPAETFRFHVAEDVRLAHAAALLLAGYWRQLVTQIKNLKLRSGAERLAAYLLALATQAEGPASVTLPEERKLIASRLGLTPETLSRAFRGLAAYGVSGHGRQVEIAELARLREFTRWDGLR